MTRKEKVQTVRRKMIPRMEKMKGVRKRMRMKKKKVIVRT